MEERAGEASSALESEQECSDDLVDEGSSSSDNTEDGQSEVSADDDGENLHGSDFSEAVLELLDRSEVLFRYEYGFSSMVLRVTENIVAKLVRMVDGTTEYSALEYLRDHAPRIPAPRPCGLLKLSNFLVMFSSYVPGEDLEKVWPQLDSSQKQDISSQVDTLFSELRSLPRASDMPLGGVKGEGCKDTRRSVRRSTTPIMTNKEFEDFIFTSERPPSSVYTQFIKSFIPSGDGLDYVFTHGDLRTANIRVAKDKSGKWAVTGIIDWECSGFYPDYWEMLKITNTMNSFEKSDWYLYLPKSLSPLRSPQRWLVDRLWDNFVM